MGRPQISVQKRQREQARRERQQLKAEKRAQRKSSEPGSDIDTVTVTEGIPSDEPAEATAID
jgi:hypothetical protein